MVSLASHHNSDLFFFCMRDSDNMCDFNNTLCQAMAPLPGVQQLQGDITKLATANKSDKGSSKKNL